MRLTVTQFMTLDGVVQGPGAPEEDPSDGFDLGGWLPPHFDEAVGAYMGEIFQVADEFLLGRRTYDLMAAYWPGQTNPDGSAFELNALPKHVATAQTVSWRGRAPCASTGTRLRPSRSSSAGLAGSCRCMAAGRWSAP